MRTVLLLAMALAVGVAAPARAGPRRHRLEPARTDFRPTASEQAGGVHRFSCPHMDLNVTFDGVAIRPAWRSRTGGHAGESG